MATCSTCLAEWEQGEFTENCLECGGFAMTRSCPNCSGKCGAIWKRQVSMSNSFQEAFYKGGCRLKEPASSKDDT